MSCRIQPLRSRAAGVLCGTALVLQPTGCSRLSPQIQPTDVAALERLEDFDDREEAYAENQIYLERGLGKTRYRKGTHPNAPAVQWQSLDTVLRSDVNSAATLPSKKRRTAVVLASLAGLSGVVAISGVAATSREGLNSGSLDGGGALLLGGAVLTLGFTVAAGLVFGSMRRDYERAVNVYNDSLGMRMGLLTPDGRRIVASGLATDSEGYVLTDDEGTAPPRPEPTETPKAEQPLREGPPREEQPVAPPTEGVETPAGAAGAQGTSDASGSSVPRADPSRDGSSPALGSGLSSVSRSRRPASSKEALTNATARGLSARDTVGANL